MHPHPREGTFFNDVTGAEGAQEIDLVEGLPDLLAQAGSDPRRDLLRISVMVQPAS